jgi:hypothetical protein
MSSKKREPKERAASADSTASKKLKTKPAVEDEEEMKPANVDAGARAKHNSVLTRHIIDARKDISLSLMDLYPLRALRRAGVNFVKTQILEYGWLADHSPIVVQPIKGTDRFRVIEGNHRLTILQLVCLTFASPI